MSLFIFVKTNINKNKIVFKQTPAYCRILHAAVIGLLLTKQKQDANLLIYTFFLYKQHQAQIGKKLSKS